MVPCYILKPLFPRYSKLHVIQHQSMKHDWDKGGHFSHQALCKVTSAQLGNIHLSLSYPTVLLKGYPFGQVARASIVLQTKESEVPQNKQKLHLLVFTRL